MTPDHDCTVQPRVCTMTDASASTSRTSVQQRLASLVSILTTIRPTSPSIHPADITL